ncbi:hypothetical protein BH09ACT8_BH09ACT8_57720 [soil metagenome]
MGNYVTGTPGELRDRGHSSFSMTFLTVLWVVLQSSAAPRYDPTC